MANFKFVISDKDRSWQVEKPQGDCPILGKKIGDSFSAGFLGIEGYELSITGGSDKDGFPMRKDIEGTMRRPIVITPGVGFAGKKGDRIRKNLRGNTIAQDIIQINCKVSKAGEKPLAEILGIKQKEKKEEKDAPKEEKKVEKKEAKKEEKKSEAKPEEKKEVPKKETPKEEKKPEKKEEKK